MFICSLLVPTFHALFLFSFSFFSRLMIVNYGDVNTTLGDFADSLKPRGRLSNSIADCILHIMRDNQKSKGKLVLPYRTAISSSFTSTFFV